MAIKEDCVSFSQSNLYVFIARNLEKIYMTILILLLVLGYLFRKDINLYGLIYVCAFLGIILLPLRLIFLKTACHVVIDFGSKKLKLVMCRRKKQVEASFVDVRDIKLNGYLIFDIRGKKIYYSFITPELLHAVNKIKEIRWGILCNVFGPKDEFRILLGREKGDKARRNS